MAAFKIAAKLVGTPGSPCCCTVAGVLTCRSKGGTVTLCGWSEFSGYASTPPKKYLTMRDRCVGESTCSSGAHKTGDSWTDHTFNPAVSCAGFETTNGGAADCAICDVEPTTTSATSATVTRSSSGWGLGSCCPSDQTETKSFTRTKTLFTEDTEDAAAARMIAAASWSAWTAAPENCGTIWTVRTTGFDFGYREAEAKMKFAGLSPGWPYLMRMKLWQRAVGGTTWTHIGFLGGVHDAYGDGTYEVTETLPIERGFEFYASDPVALKQ